MLGGWWRRAAGLPVEGTIDIRIFAATAGNGKKSPSPALTAGDLSLIPTHPSKKTRSKVDKEERKMAEEVHMVRLGFERAQSTAAYPAVVGAGSSKKKPALGQVQLRMQTEKDQPRSGEVEKLVDI
ncbi:hypothetical protein CH063_15819 [Colletotrichum higginsianum]|uniref:Uncharacterized protein n=1 Tax=Colletotrichum higginsianum (strain IMI 349063) TaxID=759273 RepID=H1W4K8_COLHI|nr:hypothetical protein CH063_15819 [Colletotrichum higginsianum]